MIFPVINRPFSAEMLARYTYERMPAIHGEYSAGTFCAIFRTKLYLGPSENWRSTRHMDPNVVFTLEERAPPENTVFIYTTLW